MKTDEKIVIQICKLKLKFKFATSFYSHNKNVFYSNFFMHDFFIIIIFFCPVLFSSKCKICISKKKRMHLFPLFMHLYFNAFSCFFLKPAIFNTKYDFFYVMYQYISRKPKIKKKVIFLMAVPLRQGEGGGIALAIKKKKTFFGDFFKIKKKL